MNSDSLKEQLEQAKEQLIQSEKLASLGQMTAGIAHEINNPINFVLSGSQGLRVALEELLELLEAYEQVENAQNDTDRNKLQSSLQNLKRELSIDELKEDVVHFLGSIEKGARRATEIIYGLRTFSRLDDSRMKLGNIHEGIDSTLIILRNKYRDRIEIVKNYAPDLPQIKCFLGQLNQVFMNLIANAIDAIEGKGSIYIQTQQQNDTIIIGIKDTGNGISDEMQAKVFEPFFTTKQTGKGTGLGLSISKDIIEKHSGELMLESAKGQGTTFTIKLPIQSL